ncbi:Crp/Fnr family transcriptional regulator [Larkinella knui]|uniref:Crp/Fnr family transcriptional regulator n=1 Tax=Larkinella knui TaxID=2025310 RepID=A0A3P1CKW4_9BACT|nr:Crp/Fnr family transcriptional regulator [Larkinella knui]RRB13840.1 Crp/Fnr family transcriptional regulator [Larkinella knui]
MQQDWTTMRTAFDQLVPLPDGIWEAVLAVAHPALYQKKKILLEPGQICDRMLFIHQGAMRSYRIQEGLDITYFFFFPDLFAFATDFASFKTDQPTHYYLECIDDCRVTMFHRSDIFALYERYPEMQKFGRLMAEYAYLMMDRRMSHFQFHNLETRYLALLQEEPALLQRVPQHLIATYLGVTPESLSRIKQQVVR